MVEIQKFLFHYRLKMINVKLFFYTKLKFLMKVSSISLKKRTSSSICLNHKYNDSVVWLIIFPTEVVDIDVKISYFI